MRRDATTQPSGMTAAQKRLQEVLAAPPAPENDAEALEEALQELARQDQEAAWSQEYAYRHQEARHVQSTW